mmetsp:Transcript_4560/g.13172  ORF Transcript_4560/g.13172 Transcript_4560/m.13172 type:complete len:384 (+) Transcript_4560:1-1152(+)
MELAILAPREAILFARDTLTTKLALGAALLFAAPRRSVVTLQQRRDPRADGQLGLAAALQNLVERGEAATLDEAQTVLSQRGHAASLQKLVDSGEAATLDEASKLAGQRARAASLQKLVDSGEAATLEEASKLAGQRGRAAALQKLVDSGEAATLEEAQQVLSRSGHQAALQGVVERGDAATLEEAQVLHSQRGRAAALQKLVDSGDAATLEEASKLAGQRGRAAALQKLVDSGEAATLEEAQVGYSMNAGVAAALSAGKYTRFPGVRWRKDSRKWRVQFSVGSKKISLGSHATEEEAALVHDEYVRRHGLARPLHFPREGEASSGTFRERHAPREARVGSRGPRMAVVGDESELGAALWTVALVLGAYLSSYASEGYEPHKL